MFLKIVNSTNSPLWEIYEVDESNIYRKILESNFEHDLESFNPLYRRYFIRIKNQNKKTIWRWDTQLNTNIWTENKKKYFIDEFNSFIEFCLEILLECQKNQHIIDKEFSLIKKCHIGGTDSSLGIYSVHVVDLGYFLIIKDLRFMDDPCHHRVILKNNKQNKYLILKFIKHGIRYGRILTKMNKEDFSKLKNFIGEDYYPRYGNDSKKIIEDTYRYLNNEK